MKIKTRKLTLEEQKKIITMSYNYVSIISNPYKVILTRVVQSKYCGIYLIKNPSEDLQFKSIKKCTESIAYINNPTKNVQIECVKHNPKAIFYIDNPCQEAVDFAIIYNLDLNDDQIINYIKYCPRNSRYFRFISEKVEDFLITECNEAVYWLPKPSVRMQIWAIKNGLAEYVEKYQLCKEALDYMKIKYILDEDYYKNTPSWKSEFIVSAFLSQHNLELEPIELYKILKNYDVRLEPYLSYDIVDKLLEINPYDIKKYNVKEPSLLEKYKHQNNLLNIGLF